MDISVFDGIRAAITADRPAFLSQFFANFFNVDVLGGKRISDEVVRLSWMIGAGAPPRRTAWGQAVSMVFYISRIPANAPGRNMRNGRWIAAVTPAFF